MIFDTLKNRHLYMGLNARIDQALEHIADTDFSQLPVGSYELDGKNLFVIINDYQTKPKEAAPFEVHRQYIDVQYVVSGEEQLGYLPLGKQPPSQAYNENHDYEEYSYDTCQPQASFLPFKQGMFAVFFPEDMHMPGVNDQGQERGTAVRKVVIKVKI